MMQKCNNKGIYKYKDTFDSDTFLMCLFDWTPRSLLIFFSWLDCGVYSRAAINAAFIQKSVLNDI